MATDTLSGNITVKTRDQARDGWARAYKRRQPLADTGPGTQPFLEASVFADGVMPIYANAIYLGDATSVLTTRGKALDEEAIARGRARKAATGSIGYVVVATATGGSSVVAGDELKHKSTNIKFRCLDTKAVADGDTVAVQGIETGPKTNLDPGAILQWTSPRPGMSADCTVFENTNGTGLTGGTNEETDEELQQALLELFRNPPSNGNEADVIKSAEDIAGIAMQKAFCVPGVLGPGTKTVLFTMRPAKSGDSRIPNGAQISFVEAALKDVFPGDDGIFVAALTDEEVSPVFRVTWKSQAPGWLDSTPWPPFSSDPVSVKASPAPTATSLRAETTVDTANPVVGQTIGLYNPVTRRFVAKRIKTVTTVTALRKWTLTFETNVPTSDAVFVPSAGDMISPWSDSLDSVVSPALSYFDKSGPGELFASFQDPGRRQRRVPEAGPDSWPSLLENRIVDSLFGVVADATLAFPAPPLATTVGTPPLLANIHKLKTMGVTKL